MRGEIVVEKPEGGYVIVRDGHLTGLWACYRSGRIKLVDMRVYLACHEMEARRCGAEAVKFNTAEICRLTGSGKARASLRRLEAAGLLTFDRRRIAFPDAEGLLRPFPRRLIRLLARGARASLIATAFGHILRCLFFRKPYCHSGGSCKAKYIADTFGVDLRGVKAARAELIALGWLEPLPRAQWFRNRFGGVYRIRMDWPELPPPPAADVTPSPPPDSYKELPAGDENQEPPEPGVSIPDLRPADPAPVTLADVRPADLEDTARTLELHAQAVAGGIVTGSEADRLRVVAAAEHAMATGKTNPCGLFFTLVKKKLWSYITQADEERARRRLKEHLHPAPAHAAPSRPTRAADPLTDDQLRVRQARAAANQAGSREDPFYILRRHDPTWTRPRWVAAGGP